MGVPADVTVECTAIPAAATVTASDNCDATLTVNYQETSNSVTEGCGTIVSTWTVTDNCGNSTTATQTITVQDTQPPTLVGVPADVTVECTAIPAAATVTASDNCDATLTVNYHRDIQLRHRRVRNHRQNLDRHRQLRQLNHRNPDHYRTGYTAANPGGCARRCNR